MAVSTETVQAALSGIERVGSWPIQILNIALFVMVLGICWLYLRSTRADFSKLQKLHEDERRESLGNLKSIIGETGKVIERNNLIFERIDRKLERMNGR